LGGLKLYCSIHFTTYSYLWTNLLITLKNKILGYGIKTVRMSLIRLNSISKSYIYWYKLCVEKLLSWFNNDWISYRLRVWTTWWVWKEGAGYILPL
jgi:hypothetical protein